MFKNVGENVVFGKLGSMAVVAVVAVFFSASASHAALVNGSFEDPDIAADTNDIGVFTSDLVPGWTDVGSFVRIVDDGTSFGTSLGPQDGDQWVYMETADNGVEQTVSGLIIGDEYTLSGYVGHPARYTSNSGVYVELDGLEILAPTGAVAANTWEFFSVPFTATAAIQTIGLFSQTGEAGLDNITLVNTTIPEPTTAVFLSIGLLAFPLARRRKM